MTEKNIVKLLEKELGFTNGWGIPEERYRELYLKIAKQIVKNYKRKEKRLLKKLQLLEKLVKAGNCLSNMAYNNSQSTPLTENLKPTMKRLQQDWGREKENTFKIRSKIFKN